MSIVNGKVWSLPARMPTMARPSPSALPAVIVTLEVPVGSRPAFAAAAASAAGTMVNSTGSPGLCLVTSLATSSGAVTGAPSTALTTSPACSRPSEGLSLTTEATITRGVTGMPSCLSAATLALCCDWLNSSAFSWVDSASVLPFG